MITDVTIFTKMDQSYIPNKKWDAGGRISMPGHWNECYPELKAYKRDHWDRIK